MRGFVDLVFRQDDRFYLVDYKSNWLGEDARSLPGGSPCRGHGAGGLLSPVPDLPGGAPPVPRPPAAGVPVRSGTWAASITCSSAGWIPAGARRRRLPGPARRGAGPGRWTGTSRRARGREVSMLDRLEALRRAGALARSRPPFCPLDRAGRGRGGPGRLGRGAGQPMDRAGTHLPGPREPGGNRRGRGGGEGKSSRHRPWTSGSRP